MSYGNTSCNTLAGAVTPKLNSPVESQISYLTDVATDLDKVVSELRKRLTPVTTDERATEPGADCAVPSYGESQIERDIGCQRDRINESVVSLRRLLGELRV